MKLISNFRDGRKNLKAGSALAVVLGLLFGSGPAWAQISLVKVTGCGPNAFPTTTCSIPATGSGHLIVVGFEGNRAADAITSISDNAGNSYVHAGNAASSDSVSNLMADIWYAANSLPGGTTITINITPSGNTGTATIWEFSGVSTTSPLDQTATLSNQSASSTPSGASVTTTGASEVIISVAVVQNNVTGISTGNPFTNDETLNGNGFAHLITSSTGTYTPQWTQNAAGTYASSTVSFKAAGSGTSGGNYSRCDLNQDGVVNSTDVSLAVNMAVGTNTCTATVEGPDVCTVITVQRVVNASLGQTCITYNTHAVTLSWSPSSSPNVAGYDIFRSTTSGGPYTQVNSAVVSGTTYTDAAVQPGQTYYYVATAVSTTGTQSSYSGQVSATIPTP